jgi:homospermidine synthase
MSDFLLIGYGIVGRGVFRHLRGHITVIDRLPLDVHALPGQTVETVEASVNPYTVLGLLERHSRPGTIVVETATEIDTTEVVAWCHRNGRHFINTVADIWHPTLMEWSEGYRYIDGLVQRIMKPLLALNDATPVGPTSVVMHGANTGMVNHYFKQAVRALARQRGVEVAAVAAEVSAAYVVEKDTICFGHGFKPSDGVFYNTWNIREFLLESAAHAEYPDAGTVTIAPRALQRDVFLDDMSVKGRMVSHEETFTMAHWLDRAGGNRDAVVQFLYEASPVGLISRIRHPFGSNYVERIVTTEVDCGFDLVAALVVLKDGANWYCGHRMTNPEAHAYFTETNATAWFVSASVLAAIDWVRANPDRGIRLPEFADDEEIVAGFRNWSDPANHFSRPVQNLFLSEPYADLAVENLYARDIDPAATAALKMS